jgi:hypothetical protein
LHQERTTFPAIAPFLVKELAFGTKEFHVSLLLSESGILYGQEEFPALSTKFLSWIMLGAALRTNDHFSLPVFRVFLSITSGSNAFYVP